jgi:integrase
MAEDQLPIATPRGSRLLTAAEFHRLADVPPEVEWFANLTNPQTRRAYEAAVKDFVCFTGITWPDEFRAVTRPHLIAWRDELVHRGSGGSMVRHRLASLASLFEYPCDQNAVTQNPVKGVAQPKVESSEGRTPTLGDHQARELLDAPDADTLGSKRDRAILSTLLFHALRRDELGKLKVRHFRYARKGVPEVPDCRQGRQDAVSASASRHACADPRVPGSGRARRGRRRGAVPPGPQQPHRSAGARDHSGPDRQPGAGLFGRTRLRDRRTCPAGDGGHQCT